MCEYCHTDGQHSQLPPAQQRPDAQPGTPRAARCHPDPEAPARDPGAPRVPDRPPPHPQETPAPPWSTTGPAVPLPEGVLAPRGAVPLVVCAGLLASLPLLPTDPPAPLQPPPQAVADRVARLLDAPARPPQLQPLTVLARPHPRRYHDQVHTLTYRCDSPREVRAVAVTDVSGEQVYRALPVDEHDISLDGAAPVLQCDGQHHDLMALLVAQTDTAGSPAPAPGRMLVMTRTAPADQPTVITPGERPREEAGAVEQSWLLRYPYPSPRRA